jgi:LPS export ABC transporter protein LptC
MTDPRIKMSPVRLFSTCMILLVLVAATSCRNDIAEIRAITDVNSLPVQTSYHSEYVFSEQGRLRNKLVATQLDQYEGDLDYIEASGGFTMIFFDSTQNEEARLSAVHGRFTEKEKKMVAWENVELVNVKGDTLRTQELTFLQDSARIYTDKDVLIISANGSVLRGKGLESNDSFTKYRIIKPIGDFVFEENQDSTHVETH